MRAASEGQLPNPQGFTPGSEGGNDGQSGVPAKRYSYEDTGLDSLPIPKLRGSIKETEPEGSGAEKKYTSGHWDEETASPRASQNSGDALEGAAAGDKPTASAQMSVEQSKDEKAHLCGCSQWSRRTWIFVALGLLIVVIAAIVVPVTMTSSDDSSSVPKASDPGNSTNNEEEGNNSTSGFNKTGGFNETSETSPVWWDTLENTTETTSSVVPNDISELDEDFLRFVMLSAEVCHAVALIDTEEVLPDASVFLDEPDKALVVQRANICFGAFRGTSQRIDDWLQNFDRRMNNDICSTLTGECCNTRQGFVDGYNTSYRAEFEAALNGCVEACPDCEVVFTGHSQGGAIAQVAGVKFDHLNPIIITFGQPFTMDDPCPPIDQNRMFRFVNTIVAGSQILYDPVPYLRRVGDLTHFGKLYVLGEDVNSVAFYDENNALLLGRGVIAIRRVLAAHFLIHYRDRLRALFENGTLPIDTGGFSIDQVCHHPTECTFPHICGRRRCTRGETGDPCNDDTECLAGECSSRACV